MSRHIVSSHRGQSSPSHTLTDCCQSTPSDQQTTTTTKSSHLALPTAWNPTHRLQIPRTRPAVVSSLGHSQADLRRGETVSFRCHHNARRSTTSLQSQKQAARPVQPGEVYSYTQLSPLWLDILEPPPSASISTTVTARLAIEIMRRRQSWSHTSFPEVKSRTLSPSHCRKA